MNRISFRAGNTLLAQVHLRANGSHSIAARRDLTRYYRLLKLGQPELTKEEFNLLCDLCKETHFGDFELSPAKMLLVILQGQGTRDKGQGVDLSQLIAKINHWNELNGAAVVDSIEQLLLR